MPPLPARLSAATRAALLDNLGNAVVATDSLGHVTYWNLAAETLLGWPSADMIGQDVVDFSVPFFNGHRVKEILDTLLADRVWNGPLVVEPHGGIPFTAYISASPLHDEQGGISGVVAVLGNIGPMLMPFNRRSREAAIITDASGKVHLASPAVRQVLGCDPNELMGVALLEHIHHDDRAAVARATALLSSEPDQDPFDFRLSVSDGGEQWVQALLTDLLDDPSVGGVVWTIRNTSAEHARVERLTHEALHDPLTGLANRVLLAQRLRLAASRRRPTGALLFIDLDDFKRVNDDLGHGAGDALLLAVSERIRGCVRPEDTCARWAGDEFVVVTEAVSGQDEALELARRVSAAIARPFQLGGAHLEMTASIGMSLLSQEADIERLIALADQNMYRAKRDRTAAASLHSRESATIQVDRVRAL